MSLDVYLRDSVDDECKCCWQQTQDLYWANITHNLNTMADKAWIYEALWHPSEIWAVKAKDIIPLLEKGLKKLKDNPTKYKKYNSKNWWGTYEHFIPFVEDYLEACKWDSEAYIIVST